MRAFWISITLLGGLLSSAHADTREYEKHELARYQKYVTAPVQEFVMFDLFRSQVVGPQNVIAWSTIKDAYLITVDKPCTRLEWTQGLTLTQAQKWKVSAKFDFVAFDKQRCRITEIRPIDLVAMSKAEPAKPANPDTKS